MTDADKFRLAEIRATWERIGYKSGTLAAVAKLDVMFLVGLIDKLEKRPPSLRVVKGQGNEPR